MAGSGGDSAVLRGDSVPLIRDKQVFSEVLYNLFLIDFVWGGSAHVEASAPSLGVSVLL